MDAFRTTHWDGDYNVFVVEENVSMRPSSSGIIYPPLDPVVVANMCKYIREAKRVPMEKEGLHQPNQVPSTKFIPSETTCHNCSTKLSRPIKISSKACNLTMKGVVEGVETYFKHCDKCGMCYRY